MRRRWLKLKAPLAKATIFTALRSGESSAGAGVNSAHNRQ